MIAVSLQKSLLILSRSISDRIQAMDVNQSKINTTNTTSIIYAPCLIESVALHGENQP